MRTGRAGDPSRSRPLRHSQDAPDSALVGEEAGLSKSSLSGRATLGPIQESREIRYRVRASRSGRRGYDLAAVATAGKATVLADIVLRTPGIGTTRPETE